MRLDLFFKGKLSREEMATAFLATLLDQRDDFRSFFFNEANIPEPDSQCAVDVETDNIDIRLLYPSVNTLVMIEVKVKGSSIKADQLKGYFTAAKDKDPGLKIVALLVVPRGGQGHDVLQRTRACDSWRVHDTACSVTWSKLATFTDRLSKYDINEAFIRSGFEMVNKIVLSQGGTMYSMTHGRDLLYQLMQSVAQRLEKAYAKRFRVWVGRDMMNLYPIDTDFSPGSTIWFQTDPVSPGKPVHIPTRDDVRVSLETVFGLSDRGKKNPEVKDKWKNMLREKVIEMPTGIKYELKGRWYTARTDLRGPAADLEEKIYSITSSLVNMYQRLM